MVFDRHLSAAIIAVYQSFGVLEFRWHGLCFNCSLQVPELPLHVDNASAADRTFVGTFHMFVIASMMNTVTTPHEHHSLGRSKHVLAADRAITVS